MNGIFTLGWADVIKGLIVTIISAILVALYGVVVTSNFSIFTADWATIGKNIADISVVTLISYLVKNFISDNNGKVAGIARLG